MVREIRSAHHDLLEQQRMEFCVIDLASFIRRVAINQRKKQKLSHMMFHIMKVIIFFIP
jgi:hypothetical protein